MSPALRSTGRWPPGSSPALAGGRGAAAFEERPVDLVHLARQTFGDKRLETELLRMFARQARQILAAVEDRAAGLGPTSLADLLHSLLGSASVVGASRVARIAERCDATLRRPAPVGAGGLAEEDLRALRAAVEDACAFIGAVLEPA